MPLCTVCELEESTAKCTTCQKCRSYIHRWANERESRMVSHFDNLRIRTRRLTTFAVIKDEEVRYVDFKDLQENRVIFLSKRELNRKARANVVSIKVAEQLRRRTA